MKPIKTLKPQFDQIYYQVYQFDWTDHLVNHDIWMNILDKHVDPNLVQFVCIEIRAKVWEKSNDTVENLIVRQMNEK